MLATCPATLLLDAPEPFVREPRLAGTPVGLGWDPPRRHAERRGEELVEVLERQCSIPLLEALPLPGNLELISVVDAVFKPRANQPPFLVT